MEEWRPTKEDSHYEVSNYGRVRSIDRVKTFAHHNQYGACVSVRKIKGRILKIKNNTYSSIWMPVGDRYVHRLVAEAFLGDITDKEINHKDGNKHNNNVDNLEIVSRTQNQDHAYDIGLNTTIEKSISVIVNGKTYISLGEASRDTGIPIGVLSERLKKPDVKRTGNFKYTFTIQRI